MIMRFTSFPLCVSSFVSFQETSAKIRGRQGWGQLLFPVEDDAMTSPSAQQDGGQATLSWEEREK